MTGNTVYVLLKGEVDTLNQKIDDAIVGVFTYGGSVAFENLPALSLDKVGWAYQITDEFTTTSDFVEGAGKDYPAGTFVSIANTGTDASPVLKYNAMLGVIIVDTALSTTSKNAVENRVITTDLLTRLQKVSAMPQNPSNNDLVLWQGDSIYTPGHVYKYVVASGDSLYAWHVSNPDGLGNNTIVYTKSLTPTETTLYKANGEPYDAETDDPTFEFVSYDSVTNKITVEILDVNSQETWEKTAGRISIDDRIPTSGWVDVTGYITAGQKDGTALGTKATAEGEDTESSGAYAHAEGLRSEAKGNYSHAEGFEATALGESAHAEGSMTYAEGDFSHAEGAQSEALGKAAHAENWSYVTGDYSHGEGSSIVHGNYAHGEGSNTLASGDASHAGGIGTKAQRRSQMAMGEYNVVDTDGASELVRGKYAVIIGNGTGDNARSNALTLEWNGNLEVSGEVKDGNGTKISDCEKSGVAETLVKDTVGWTGKNKLPMTVDGIKAANTSGTWSGNVYTHNGIDYTILTDDSDNVIGIKENGAASGDSLFNFPVPELSAGSYVLNGTPNGLEGITALYVQTDGGTFKYDNGNGVNFSVTSVVNACRILVVNTMTVTDIIFHPMIRLAIVADSTFEPYHATVDTVKADKVTNATSGHLAGLDANGNLTDSGVSPTEDVTVEGNPVTFDSPFEQDAKSVVVSVKPIQDLHGLPFPYVGGAYKNKLPLTVARIKAANIDGTWTGNVYTINDVTVEILTDNADNVTGIKINGTASSEVHFSLHGFGNGAVFSENAIMTGCPSGGSNNSYKLYISNNITSDASDTGSGVSLSPELFNSAIYNNLFTWIVISANYTATNLIFYPMIRLATETDPTFAPYSNICPISGIDEVEIGVSGKNLFDESSVHNDKFIGGDGVEYSQEGVSCSDYILVSAGTHFISNPNFTNVGKFAVIFYDVDKTFISTALPNMDFVEKKAFDVPSGVSYIRINAKNTDIAAHNVYINVGANDLGYEPHKGSTTTIPLPSTLYGGTVRVDEGDADGTYGIGDIGLFDTTWTYDSANNRFITGILADVIKHPLNDSTLANILCEGLKPMSLTALKASSDDALIAIGDTGGVSIRLNAANGDQTALKTLLTGVKLYYELATPTTLSLTPTDVELLEGTNVVSTNAEKVAVTYKAGILATLGDIDDLNDKVKTKFDKKDVAKVEGTNASKPYAVGDYMLRYDGFYRVTAPIASGASITANNTIKTTIADNMIKYKTSNRIQLNSVSWTESQNGMYYAEAVSDDSVSKILSAIIVDWDNLTANDIILFYISFNNKIRMMSPTGTFGTNSYITILYTYV